MGQGHVGLLGSAVDYVIIRRVCININKVWSVARIRRILIAAVRPRGAYWPRDGFLCGNI